MRRFEFIRIIQWRGGVGRSGTGRGGTGLARRVEWDMTTDDDPGMPMSCLLNADGAGCRGEGTQYAHELSAKGGWRRLLGSRVDGCMDMY